MFDKNEVNAWEDEIYIRTAHATQKKFFDPRKDALIRHRHRSPYHRYRETSWMRKQVQRSFRTKMKQLLAHEKYHNPVPQEYKTYGWYTW